MEDTNDVHGYSWACFGFIEVAACCILVVMKLNADIGEGVGDDESLFRWIDMANIACGAHAGGEQQMEEAVELAVSYGVAIGAHPGYADREGFGRRSMELEPGEIGQLIIEQVEALDAICQRAGTKLQYVKPHGALYHDMMSRPEVYDAILQAVAWLPQRPALMIMARQNDHLQRDLAMEHSVPLLFEAFADRAYTAAGELLDRAKEGAVHSSTELMVEQVMQLAQQGTLTSCCGQTIALKADTVCVHGDNEASIAAAQEIYQVLRP